MDCLLRVGNESLPQVKEFKYLGVLFASEGTMEREIGRRIGAAGAVLHSLLPHRCDEKRAEPEGKALDLPFNLRSYSHLWSWGLGHDRKNEVAGASGRNGFPQEGGWRLP